MYLWGKECQQLGCTRKSTASKIRKVNILLYSDLVRPHLASSPQYKSDMDLWADSVKESQRWQRAQSINCKRTGLRDPGLQTQEENVCGAIRNAYKCLTEDSKENGARLLSSFQWREKRQWAQIKIQEKRFKNMFFCSFFFFFFFTMSVVIHWNRLPPTV